MKGKKINFKISDNLQRGVSASLLLLPGILVVLPVVLLVTGSVMDQYELAELLKPIFREKGAGEAFQFITWRLVPDFPSFANYGKLLFLSPQFFVLFWNSVKMVLLILAGQLLIGVPAAWAFAAYQNRFGKLLFTLYVVLMLLPFQVTMLSSYLVLNRLSLLNTQNAVILPAVFSTFPVFLCYGGFRAIPMQLFEAARVDGANRWQQMLNVTLPCIRSTIVILLIMQLGKIMGGSFERIMALMNYAATEYTTTIPVLVYQWGIQDMKFSQSTALGLFQSIIGLALVLGSDWVSKKLGEDGLV